MRFLLTIAALTASAFAAPQFGRGYGRGWPYGNQNQNQNQNQNGNGNGIIVTGPPQSGYGQDPRVIISGSNNQGSNAVLTNSNGVPIGTISLGTGQQLPTVIITDGGQTAFGTDEYGNEIFGDNNQSGPNTVVISGNGVDSTSISVV